MGTFVFNWSFYSLLANGSKSKIFPTLIFFLMKITIFLLRKKEREIQTNIFLFCLERVGTTRGALERKCDSGPGEHRPS